MFGAVSQTRYYDSIDSIDPALSDDYTLSTIVYDARNLPKHVVFQNGNSSDPPRTLAVQTRNVAGLVTKRRTNATGAMNFVESNWSYDKLGRVTSQAVVKDPAPSEVVRQDLQYFGNDDPSSLTHHLGTDAKQFNFLYDRRHQLRKVTTDVPGYFAAEYEFGTAGRFVRAKEEQTISPLPPGSEVKSRDVAYVYGNADPEQVTALISNATGTTYASYAYDDAGNMTARCYGGDVASCPGEKTEFVYDGKDQLRRARKMASGVVTGVEEYWYDADGHRAAIVKRDGSGAKTGMVWFINDVEAHYDATGAESKTHSHLSLGTPIARVTRASSGVDVEYQFHGLANNSVAAVADDGLINARFAYAPFGIVVEGDDAGSAAHRRRYNDKYVDALSDLTYYGARYYDKSLMGWTQGDPLFRFVPDLAEDRPREAQLYTVNLQNPLRYIDPDGRWALALPFAKMLADAAVGVIGIVLTGAAVKASVDTSAEMEGYVSANAASATVEAVPIALDLPIAREETSIKSSSSAQDDEIPPAGGAEHSKNKRPSNRKKHEDGTARKKRDRGGEKGDSRRRPPARRPKDYKGPWPPRPKNSGSPTDQTEPKDSDHRESPKDEKGNEEHKQ